MRVPTIANMNVVEYNNERVLSTEQIANAYECDTKNISDNFKNNESHFIEGKHYYKLEGKELKEFKRYSENIGLPINKFAPCIYLWTKRGASRHCKMLGTDRAWDMFDMLEESYFNPVSHDSYLIADPIKRAERWIEEQKEKQRIQNELNVAKPLALETQKFIDSNHLIGFRELARELNIKETELNRVLVEHGWKYKTISGNYKYYKKVVTNGWMETKDAMNEDTGWSGTSNKFTVKGRMKIEEYINKESL